MSVLGLVAIFALILLNAYFVATEFSLVAVRRSQVAIWVAERRPGAVATARALDRLDDAIAATQLGITLASIGLGFLGAPVLAVLIGAERVASPLLPMAHLGVGCASRAEVDRLVAEARAKGRAVWGPTDSPAPVGYWALISDPDNHTLELSHGQEVALTVARS